VNDPMKISATHLTQDELDSFLVGDPAPEATSHLAGCEPCQAALAELEMPLASFRAVTLAWSERRSATMPLRDLEAAQSRAAAAWRQRFALSAGLAAALAVGVAVPVLHHEATRTDAARNQPSAQGVATTETASASPVDSPQQIARDNQMLRAIDQELNSSADNQAALGLQESTGRFRGYHSKMQD
jgi:anti-sigma factor RsiW